MRLSFPRFNPLRFQSHSYYTARIHTHTGTASDNHRQLTLTGAHPPQATSVSLVLRSSGRRLIYNALADNVQVHEEPTAPFIACVGSESNNYELQGGKQALSDVALSSNEDLDGPKSGAVAQRKVWDALQQRLPHELLRVMLDASQDLGYMKSLPSTTWIEILEILHPRHFVAELKKIYRDLHPNQVEALGTPQLNGVFAYYTSSVRKIIDRRLHAREESGIEEYRFLLQVVASVGDGATALEIWTEMVDCKVEPSLECYNLYFEARCWSGAYLPKERHKMRMIPYILELRRPRKSEFEHVQRLQGYQTGLAGVKDEVRRMFTIMVNRGIMADVKTFGLLMVGLSREGDTKGVKSILKSVWDVDVDSVLQKDQDPQKPTNLARESPLYPTSATLHTIAHIFGSNNELGTALRVVDYVSRRYSVAIDTRVWDELLEWAYVLSSRRHGRRKEDGASRGQLPLKSIERLWSTMVSPPYNIRPNMRMHNYYCINLYNRQMLDEMLRTMQAGLALYWSQAAKYEELRHLYGMNSSQPSEERNRGTPPSIEFSHRDIALGALTEHRNFLMVSRWCRLLLGGSRWGGELDRILVWERQGLPNAIREFWHFRPRPVIWYHIATGKVELTVDEDMELISGHLPKQGFYGDHFYKRGSTRKRR